MSERILGLFAKIPRTGHVKTRLAAATTPEWAARVAAAFLGDTMERLADIAARRILVHAPDDAEQLEAERFELLPQGSGNLGVRLNRFFAAHIALGPVVVIGADSPTLPVSLIDDAYHRLETHDVVIGPATDGGYYLLGCRRHFSSLFCDIDWSGSQVLRQTIERMDSLDASLSVLQPWYDVDTLDDWHTLTGHIAALRRAGIAPLLPRTEALLREGLP